MRLNEYQTNKEALENARLAQPSRAVTIDPPMNVSPKLMNAMAEFAEARLILYWSPSGIRNVCERLAAGHDRAPYDAQGSVC